MSRTLLVLAHPRQDSLTSQVAARLHAELADQGHTVDLLDLYAEKFDPLLLPDDEPDWQNREKQYTPEVHAHMRRIDAADEIVVVFPVWWFSVPAILKGWIDRVWNYGFAYGRSKPRLAAKRMLWIGLAGLPRAEYESSGLGAALEAQLVAGISQFCGIQDSAARLLYETELSGVPEAQRGARVGEVLAQAETELAEFRTVTSG